jgi:hypothetical protein
MSRIGDKNFCGQMCRHFIFDIGNWYESKKFTQIIWLNYCKTFVDFLLEIFFLVSLLVILLKFGCKVLSVWLSSLQTISGKIAQL